MHSTISIENTEIGGNNPPYIIAEISANHNGDIENAFKIIEVSKKCGANAVKLQTYTADTITLDIRTPEFMIQGGLWDGQSLYELYQKAYTPWEWHKPLFEFAKKLEMTIFSSPFDSTAVDLLEDLNAPAYKIASFEAVDLPLIKYVASTGKPVIISTGMANELEIQEAIEAAMEGGGRDIALLHCVSGYPALAEEYNLKTIKDMQQRFNLPVGLSDHTLDNTTAISSVAIGASIIEKHVTLSRQGGGPDDSFSLEPNDLSALCKSCYTAWQAMGTVDYGKKASEQGNVKFRRSLYFIKDIKNGETITKEHVKSIRPGYGLAPKHLETVLGKKVNQDISRGTPVDFNLLQDL